ncbi:hypothetical protein EF908_40435, partial [Streptomyces sp. WAC04770]
YRARPGSRPVPGLTAVVGSWAAILVGAVRRLRRARSRGEAAIDCWKHDRNSFSSPHRRSVS